jgi:hypothetical protein
MFVEGERSGLPNFLQRSASELVKSFRLVSRLVVLAMAGNRLSFSAEKAPCSLSFRERRVPLSAEVQRNDFLFSFQPREWNDGPSRT